MNITLLSKGSHAGEEIYLVLQGEKVGGLQVLIKEHSWLC
jgi:hypothetical protein